MELTVFKDHDALSDHVSDQIIELVTRKPGAVICLAAGDTPKLAYNLVAQKAGRFNIDFTKCTFIGLDEWAGIPPRNEGSCHYFLRNNVFIPLHITDDRIHLFDALASDLQEQCRKMDDVIAGKGGIDMIVVGVGMNGHVGFNEPGVPFERYCHVIELEDATRTVGQKYFREQTTLTQGITLGLKHFIQSRCALVVANGAKKAEVIRKTIEEPVTPNMPASIIQNHINGHVMLDEGAASRLTR